jgi:small conductance mechanosensitive channel
MDQDSVQSALDTLVPYVTTYGLRVLGAILILVLGRIVAGLVGKGVKRAALKAHMDPSVAGFLAALAKFGVLAFAVIAALAKFGVQTTSFVAVVGAAGLAVGLALQGSLSNFAAGVLLLIFKPIKVGDLVEVAGKLGKVVKIDLFVTVLHTLDNQKVFIPNASVTGDVIVNVNANELRRVDLVAGISYGDDMSKAKGILEGILESHPAVVAEPAPQVAVSELGDSSVNFVVRPWCKPEDYWRVYFEVTQQIKERFDAQGVSIPFPQRDVHLFQETAKQGA